MSKATPHVQQSFNGSRRISTRRRTVTAIAAITVFGLVPFAVVANPGTQASAATRVPAATISPRGVTVTAGSSVDLAVRLSSSKPANLRVTLTGQPSGVSGSLECSSSRDCTLQLVAAPSAPEATALVFVALRSGSSSRQTPIAVHVKPVATTPPPTTTPPTPATTTTTPTTSTGVPRTLSLRPESFNVTNRSGTRSTFVINLVRNGWTDPVDMTVEGLPASWRAAFLTNPATAATTLVVDSPVEAVAGEYALRIVGRSGSLTSETVVIVRLKPPEIRLELVTPGAVVSPGGAARFVINARSVDDSARPVNLRVEGLPNGATATILPNPATGNSNVDISVSAATIPGNYGFQIVALLDGVELRLNAVLLVAVQYTTNFQFSPTPVTAVPGQNRGYGLASPSSVVVAPAGGFVSFDVNVSPIGGFGDLINMSLITPVGWSISWLTTSPNVVRVTVGPPASAPKGASALELRTTSGSLAATLSITANVT
jgi:hypothetical protein